MQWVCFFVFFKLLVESLTKSNWRFQIQFPTQPFLEDLNLPSRSQWFSDKDTIPYWLLTLEHCQFLFVGPQDQAEGTDVGK